MLTQKELDEVKNIDTRIASELGGIKYLADKVMSYTSVDSPYRQPILDVIDEIAKRELSKLRKERAKYIREEPKL